MKQREQDHEQGDVGNLEYPKEDLVHLHESTIWVAVVAVALRCLESFQCSDNAPDKNHEAGDV